MRKKSVRRPISQFPTPESQSTNLSSLLHDLAVQTHLDLTTLLEQSRYRQGNNLSPAEFFELMGAAADYWNREQGVVR